MKHRLRNLQDAASNDRHTFHVLKKPYADDTVRDKVSGEAEYTADLYFPGLLYGVAVRSPYPHARVLHIDAGRALAQSGVQSVLTAKDVPGAKDYGYIYQDTPVLAYDTVLCVGDPVALVIAQSEELAQEAAALVEVEYEELPGVFTVEQALNPDSISLHKGGNLLRAIPLRKGDIALGRAKADVVVSGTYETQRVAHLYLELECSVARCHAGGVQVFTSSQDVFSDRRQVAKALSLPLEKVQVLQQATGGGFGGKIDVTTEILAALGAYCTKAPVRVQMCREESMRFSSKRHPIRFELTLGATHDGKLCFLEGIVTGDTGAYASSGDKVIRKSIISLSGPYFIPHLHIDSYTVYTNNPQCGAMRGFGQMQASFALESIIDELADELGIDRWILRKNNLLQPGDTNAIGQIFAEDVGISATMKAAQAYLRAHPLPLGAIPEGCAYGIGYGNGMFATGLGLGRADTALVQLTLNEDGECSIQCGAADIGQGTSSLLAMIVAEFVGIQPNQVHVVLGDTATTPPAGPTTATRLTYVCGLAVKNAAQKLLEILEPVIYDMVEHKERPLVGNDELELIGGTVHLNGQPMCITLRDIAAACFARRMPLCVSGFYDNTAQSEDPATLQGDLFQSYTCCTQIAEIAVDPQTGQMDVLRVLSACDVGKALNPQLVEGQIEGGVLMAVGSTVMELMMLRQGILRNPSCSSYLIPTTMDSPEIVSILVEEPDAKGPLGAKGIGEPAVMGVSAAIANAVNDALRVRLRELPLRPDAILNAIIAQ